ncbi:MAG: selenoneine biosynthesis selenosugar synthase SenB [Betaproteobacteria bacterium]
MSNRSRSWPSTARPTVALITPYGADSNNGNWRTASRWARFLRPHYRVRVATQWDGRDADLMIALHARRSAESIAAFAAAHLQRPLIVVLPGTALYRDIKTDAAAQRSLRLATRLVVLQDEGRRELPAALARKTATIYQSAPAQAALPRRRRTFDVVVLGHLREEKDPGLAMQVARQLPADSRVRILHIGAALDAEFGRAAAATQQSCPHYRWLGAVPHAAARRWLRRAPLLLHPSRMEGGAQAVLEAIQSGAAVVASNCAGNVGMLGRGYAGIFPVGNAAAATALIERAAREPAFVRRLQRQCRARAARFAPARERRVLLRLIDRELRAKKQRAVP